MTRVTSSYTGVVRYELVGSPEFAQVSKNGWHHDAQLRWFGSPGPRVRTQPTKVTSLYGRSRHPQADRIVIIPHRARPAGAGSAGAPEA